MLPSVSILESVAPSYAHSGQGILSLNVTNYRTDGDAPHREVSRPFTIHNIKSMDMSLRASHTQSHVSTPLNREV